MALPVQAAAAASTPRLSLPLSPSRSTPSPPHLPLLQVVASLRSGSGISRGPASRWTTRRASVRVRAGAGGGRRRKESPYEVLGVPPSAEPAEIKRAYRRLALKFHPDVNKEANAQEKFLRIKHAYNTLMNSESRSKYASSSSSSTDSSWTPRSSKPADEEEQFYGFGDFLKDLQTEFQNWEADLNSDQKPQSLWEELSAIGEEFVEFLENELNIDGSSTEENDGDDPYTQFGGRGRNAEGDNKGTDSSDDGVSDIESVLEQLKKELGLS